MESPLSTKNTKAEILEAYEALLKNVQQAKANVPKQMQEEKSKKETVDKISDVNTDTIFKSVNGLKAALNNSLDAVLAGLSEEVKKLEDIRAAIAIEKQSLQDLYSLAANTDSLAAMILAQKEKKESFEKEMEEKKSIFNAQMKELQDKWEAEKIKQKLDEKERIDELEKKRKREEDEYKYNLKITRQKELYEYENKKELLDKEINDKKQAFEQEIAKREAELKDAESELAELRKKSIEFPTQLEKMLKEKEKEITTTLQTKYEFEMKLIESQNKSDIRLKDQMISSLQEKIKEQNAQLKEYTEKANRAEETVKDIAVKAIENSSKVRVYPKTEKEEG